MAKLRMVVELDDEWAARKVARSCGDLEALARRITLGCTITTGGKVIDPNGNTIGRVEVVEDGGGESPLLPALRAAAADLADAHAVRTDDVVRESAS